ncbi:winged helix-turn-helix transcriptional regulator [Pseudohalocynthiibacter aestuariivivens]|uniref:Winged helix-turn-helix transcriptional regulator n=1 Tax=Pseudohalocynthiibacter aestuariivivens TaxID=1591409 RepID=A0ABV5JAE0_9RHOB
MLYEGQKTCGIEIGKCQFRLTRRLRELEPNGVVIRDVNPASTPSVEYSLADLGAELVPRTRQS